jgi:hypothetical protein
MPKSEANRHAQSKDPYTLTHAQRRQGVLRTVGEKDQEGHEHSCRFGPSRVERTLLSAAFDLDLDFAGRKRRPLQYRGSAALQRRVKPPQKNPASAAEVSLSPGARGRRDVSPKGPRTSHLSQKFSSYPEENISANPESQYNHLRIFRVWLNVVEPASPEP